MGKTAHRATSGSSREISIVEDDVYLPPVSADYIIDLYDRYRRDPSSVDASWLPYFEAMWGGSAQIGGPDVRPEIAAAHLIEAYRSRGHLAASLDPLGLWTRETPPELEPTHYCIDERSLDREIIFVDSLDAKPATLRGLLHRLREIYAGSIGFDLMHVDSPAARAWFYAAAENGLGIPTPEQRRVAAHDIIAATEFERFFGKRFIAKKRFGADGAEAMVAWSNALLARCVAHGVRDVIIGGTARGRLNVMANVVKKPLAAILHEFKGGRPFPADIKAASDVPYHFGYVGERVFGDAKLSVTYCHNPSHLEAIDGVAMGRVRARQDAFEDTAEGIRRVLGLQFHTDAAFAGQGVVAEVLQLGQLPDYRIGGTIHFVINNQVGFTTDPTRGRTSIYCTDVARAIGAPVLHVNADDVDAVIRTAILAADYRDKFASDIVIDFVCYRRHGHNELDEPLFTQPLMYRRIATHPAVATQYIPRLVSDGILSQDEAEAAVRDYINELEAAYAALEGYRPNQVPVLDRPKRASALVSRTGSDDQLVTGLDLEILYKLGDALSAAPKGAAINDKIAKQLAERGAAIRSGHGINWATGEALALASLALEGVNVRFSGQDTPRGAFSQRHFVLIDQNNGKLWKPLAEIQKPQGRCEIIGSPLSEYSVLAFEYGYSMDSVDGFTMWEAQFGDFANVAQVIFDQFISSAEDKWLDTSGITVMLPHGLEGQGPDHSSGRIERFLQMCADGNMIVANCSTPANLFHLLRLQAYRRPRRPLILFTTKSLLRHRSAVSDLKSFGPDSSFKPVIAPVLDHPAAVSRVILCTGKFAYDLDARLQASGRKDVIVMRLEQLYPFPEKTLRAELTRYRNASVIWCQEEPENMGAWSYIDRKLERILKSVGNGCEWPHCISRPANASTAIGINDEHNADQERLVLKAVGEDHNSRMLAAAS